MTTAPLRRPARTRALALAAVTSTALAGALVPSLATHAAPRESYVDVAPDYLVDTYGLPADHVFETVTFERFEWLLNGKHEDNTTPVTGRFAFLIGGPHDESTRATIGYIDQVAKQYGVERIYTFDPALDGDTYNIWDTSELQLDPAGKAPIEALGTRLLTYLNADTTPAFTGASTDPYLFVYDRSHTEGGVEDRIVSSLDVRETAAGLAVPGAADAYRAQVATVFDAIAVGGSAHVDQIDQFTFWETEANRRHKVSYPNAATNGDRILDDADDDAGWRIQTITYPELEHLLQQDGDYVILFGGTWCHNTRAVIKQVNRDAQEHGVPVVYNFDNSLDSTGNGGSNYLHIRDNASIPAGGTLPRRASYLYGDLWNTFLTNVATEYGSVVQFYPGGDVSQPVQTAQKGQVPFLLEYDKGNVSDGQAAPVKSQWIQDNGGVYKEYMTEWWLTPTGGVLSGNPTAQAFAAEAEGALETFFAGLPSEQTAPAAPAAPVATVNGASVTVSWDAPDDDGGSPLTGYAVALDGEAPVTVSAGVTSYIFTEVAPGGHTATVVAANAIGSSAPSAPSNVATVADGEDGPGEEEPTDPATVKGTVTVTGSLRQGGTIVVTGRGFAESTSGFAVEIHSTPQALGSVSTDATGAFALSATIPADVPAGSHSIVVLYDGTVVSSAAITVAADSALAGTGVGGVALVALGGGALGLGVLAVLWSVARRRRTA